MTAWAAKQPDAMTQPLYLDYPASTPVDAQVREAMLPWLGERFGNPHAQHGFGKDARQAVEQARMQVAAAIGASAEDVLFTSGATEANNLAIQGALRFARQQDIARRHVVTVATEHSSVLEACHGQEVTVLPVQPDGLVCLDELKATLRPDTLLVSVMAVNNETGVVQPLAEISALCRANGSYLHSDAAQALGRMALDVQALGVDMLSLSGHKTYGPQGVGALYLRRRPRARIAPLHLGGGQERGLRAGTVPVMLAVGMGVAAQLAATQLVAMQAHIARLERVFLEHLRVEYRLNGSATQRVAGFLNLGMAGADALREKLPQLALSGGAACSSGLAGPSRVLQAMGAPQSGLRIGFGRYSTEREAIQAAEAINLAAQ